MGDSTSDTVCISGLAAGPAIITTTTQSTTLRSPTTQQPLTTHISTHIEPPEVIPVPSSGTTPGATNMIGKSENKGYHFVFDTLATWLKLTSYTNLYKLEDSECKAYMVLDPCHSPLLPLVPWAWSWSAGVLIWS